MKTRLLLAMLCLTACKGGGERLSLFVGAYSDGSTAGISVYEFDVRSGDCRLLASAEGIVNPSYLTVQGDFIFSVNETAEGAVSSFSFDRKNNRLHPIGSQATHGANPCYIALSPDATALVTANYSGGSLSVFPLSEAGEIGEMTQNIAFSPRSHIHTAVFSPDGRYLLATDLGEDCIYTFAVSTENKIFHLRPQSTKTVRLEAGSGPRHLAFHPNQNTVYCINELAGTITVFRYDDGRLSPLQTLAADTTAGVGGKGSADIHLSPDGRFVYASNRLKADGIAVFAVSPDGEGRLTPVSYHPTGIHPRNFLITPNGRFLLCANRDSQTIQVFTRDEATGALHDTGKTIPHPRPVCLVATAMTR